MAAPPSDETERRRARLKVETIELRLTALREAEEMGNPKDHTKDIMDQLDLMNVGKPVQVELKVKSKLSTRPYVGHHYICYSQVLIVFAGYGGQ